MAYDSILESRRSSARSHCAKGACTRLWRPEDEPVIHWTTERKRYPFGYAAERMMELANLTD